MVEKAELLRVLVQWTNSFTEPRAEAVILQELPTVLHEKLPSLQVTDDIMRLAQSIVITENAEKITEEINVACVEAMKKYEEGPELDSLADAELTKCTEIAEGVGNMCLATAETILHRYAEPTSETWKLIRLTKIKKRVEAFLLQQFKLKDVQSVAGLAGHLTEFYTAFADMVLKKLQALRDTENQRAPKLQTLWEAAFWEKKPAFDAIQNVPISYKKAANYQFKASFLNSVLVDLEPYATTWIQQLTTKTLSLFEPAICQKATRQMILNIAFTVIPATGFEELRNSLRTALTVEDEVNSEWKQALSGFLAQITLQEKYFTILCLVIFFSQALTECNYKPQYRTFCRNIVLELFADVDGVYPVNDWIIARGCEDYLSTTLNDLGRSPFHLPGEDMKARANEALQLSTPIQHFMLVPLTPAQLPALHITIVIPGWLSEEKDMISYWDSVAKFSYYGAVLGLQWEANTTGNVVLSGAKDLICTAGAFFLPGGFITGSMAVMNLWNRNPFADSAERANETGRFLAYYIKNRAFGNVAVSLIGFSLGGRMVAAVLSALEDEPEVYIQDAIMIGGAVSHNEVKWARRRRAVAGRLINVMSRNDEVLAKVYTTAKLEKAIGSHPIELDGVENYDASDYVGGHSDHPTKLDKTLTRLNVSP